MTPSRLPPRQHIPKELEARILYEADHTCCICQDRHASDVQIHHISGRDRSTYDNLVVLCINCHSRVERGGGLGKRVTPAELKRYRANWTKQVKRRRKASMALDREFATVVELEVRKLNYKFESLNADLANEARALEVLSIIQCYARDFGTRVRDECLSTVYNTCRWLHCGSATEMFVHYQTSIVMEAMPILFGGLLGPRHKPLSKAERDLLAHGIDVAGEICYDVCKYIRKEKTAVPAVHLLCDLLRFACVNNLKKEKVELLGEFEGCIRICETPLREGPFQAGADLLREWKAWAMQY